MKPAQRINILSSYYDRFDKRVLNLFLFGLFLIGYFWEKMYGIVYPRNVGTKNSGQIEISL